MIQITRSRMRQAWLGTALIVALSSTHATSGVALGAEAEDPPGWEHIDEFRGVPVEETRETDPETGRLLLIGTRTPAGQLHGPEWSFWPNGAPHIKRVWVEGKLSGPYQVWFKSGMRRLEGTFEADGRVGVWRRYVESGPLISESEYKAGELHGAFREFYPNGKPKSERHFENGLQTGVEMRWGRGGVVELEGHWLAGAKHGSWSEVARLPGGATRSQGYLAHGKREGLWTESTMKGVKLSEKTYVEGVMEGLFTVWRPDGSKASESHYVAGKETGGVLAWYPNGQLQMQGRKVDGRREGVWTYWKADGSVDETFSGTYAGDVKVSD